MESTSRPRCNPKRQKDFVMKSRSRSPMNVDTQNAKLKNATKKLTWVIVRKKTKSSYYKSSKREEDWDNSK